MIPILVGPVDFEFYVDKINDIAFKVRRIIILASKCTTM